MASLARLKGRLALLSGRLGQGLLSGCLSGLERVLPAMPLQGVLLLADVLGLCVWAADRRGREIGRQNLLAVYGETRGGAWRRRTLRACYRNALRNLLLLFHLQPLTPARYARFVTISAEDERRFRGWTDEGRRGVLVSAHLGNWELLLAARTGLSFAPPVAYLAESTGVAAIDAALDRLRDRGSGGATLRKRGALALRQALAQGKCVSFLMDRNLWGGQGGVYVPFLGLPARTTPLGPRLAQAFGAPLGLALLEPMQPCRWRLTISDDLMPAPSGDPHADVLVALARANELLSAAILRAPDSYLWMLKRFKGRPTAEQGRYPAYSFPDL